MNNLYDALDVCLQEIELGADIETSLLRYPDLADELRPIIETSIHAKGLAASGPSENVIRRNRAKFLQRAAELRQVPSSQTSVWFYSLRRAAIALTVLAFVFLTGTSLVRASSTTLPGDNLYPVKRTSEGLVLLLTFDSLRRDSLEVEYENERLEELYELIAQGRSAEVDFAGIVTQQNGSEWLVSGIRIIVSSQTELHEGPVVVGDAIRVFGITQTDNSVLAERIDQLPPDANLPDLENSGTGSNSGSNSGSGSGNENPGNDNANENDSSGPGNGNDNNSGPGNANDNMNDDNSGSGGGNENRNENDSGSASGQDDSREIDEDNSGTGGGNDNEENSGSDSGNDNGGEDNSGSGSGNENSDEDNSGSGGGGDGD